MFRITRLLNVIVLFLLMTTLPRMATAQGLEYVKANYTKYEHRISMRDGKRLFTITLRGVEPECAEQVEANPGVRQTAGFSE